MTSDGYLAQRSTITVGELRELRARIEELERLWRAAKVHDNVAHACGEMRRLDEVPPR
jgi:hypothetical protein